MSLYLLHLEDSQENMLLTIVASAANIPSQFIQKSVQKSNTNNIQVPNIIHRCGARQLALFLTLEHYKSMLAAGKKRGGDK